MRSIVGYLRRSLFRHGVLFPRATARAVRRVRQPAHSVPSTTARRDLHAADGLIGRNTEHDVGHHVLPAHRRRPRAPVLRSQRNLRHMAPSASGWNFSFYAVHCKQRFILLDQCVLRLLQDAARVLSLSSVSQRHDGRQTADQLGDQAVTSSDHAARSWPADGRSARLLFALYLGTEAHTLLTDALLDDTLDTVECTAADKQNIGGVDLDELLMRMLASALRRYVGNRALQNFQQRLLYALAAETSRVMEGFSLLRAILSISST